MDPGVNEGLLEEIRVDSGRDSTAQKSFDPQSLSIGIRVASLENQRAVGGNFPSRATLSWSTDQGHPFCRLSSLHRPPDKCPLAVLERVVGHCPRRLLRRASFYSLAGGRIIFSKYPRERATTRLYGRQAQVHYNPRHAPSIRCHLSLTPCTIRVILFTLSSPGSLNIAAAI